MKIPKYSLIIRATYFLLIMLVSACGTNVTSTPLPSLPTFAPPTTLTSTPLVDLSPKPTESLIAVTETAQTLESAPVMASETATQQPSPTANPLVISTDLSSLCSVPNATVGWANYKIYTVRVNDTLSSLARRTNSTLEQIQQANCRNINDTLIYAGQTLYLPLIPDPVVIAGSIATPTAPPTGNSPRIAVLPETGITETIFTFKIRDYKPSIDLLIKIEYPNQTELVRFLVKLDKNGNWDVLWQSPKILLPGLYRVRTFSPDGTVGPVGTIVILPRAYP